MGAHSATRSSRLALRYAFFSLPLLAMCLLVASNAVAAPVRQLFTWPGWEPDKGAAAWYWLRFVDARAQIRIVPAGTTEAPGPFFDTPNATFRRTQNSSTFESVLRAYPTQDRAVQKLAQITRDIEINAWRPRVHPESGTLEGAFRRMQSRWPDNGPPVGCILEFFDHVHEWLGRGGTLAESDAKACIGNDRGASGRGANDRADNERGTAR